MPCAHLLTDAPDADPDLRQEHLEVVARAVCALIEGLVARAAALVEAGAVARRRVVARAVAVKREGTRARTHTHTKLH